MVMDSGRSLNGCRGRPRHYGQKETFMHKLLATLTLGMMLAVPYVATAASTDRSPGSMPAAVDQQLTQDMLQQAETQLQLAGFDPGPADGVFDARTAQAVRQYQVAQALPVSGLLDEPTRRVLFPGFQADEE
jgi:peptidoglycan hydrolase-like protein with peptidoglycan-binding domain